MKVNLLIIESDNIFLNMIQAVPLSLVMNELISNAFKHAFKDSEKGEVKISLSKSGKNVSLLIRDNGSGIPEKIDFYKTNSLGLKMVRRIIKEQLNGKIQFKNNQGAEFRIKFDVNKQEGCLCAEE